MTDSDEALQDMLDRLNRGDEQAARQVFEAYGPYLRMVVRRRLSSPLRSKLDSEDIVQSVWADLLHAFRTGRSQFGNINRLRAFLIRAACNRLIDRHRQHASALRYEESVADGVLERLAGFDADRPDERVMADDLWDRMLAGCSPRHRELLRLKREGLSPNEIAERTGLHPSSVRRILYDLARRFGIARSTGRVGSPLP